MFPQATCSDQLRAAVDDAWLNRLDQFIDRLTINGDDIRSIGIKETGTIWSKGDHPVGGLVQETGRIA